MVRVSEVVDGGFYIPGEAIEFLPKAAPFSVFVVYSYLCSISKNDVASKSYRVISEELGLSRPSVITAINTLIEFNIIRRVSGRDRNGALAPCLFVLQSPADWNFGGAARTGAIGIQKSSAGYVYLLKCGEFYKIGITTNIDSRIEQIGTLPPFDIELIHSIETDDMLELEQELHRRFGDKRKNGEWFVLDENDVNYILSI